MHYKSLSTEKGSDLGCVTAHAAPSSACLPSTLAGKCAFIS